LPNIPTLSEIFSKIFQSPKLQNYQITKEIAKAERALEISGLQIEEFLENQTIANRLVNPADPFRLGRDYSD
jgi:hypothetical protein